MSEQSPTELTRALLLRESYGFLASQSQEMEGFPFGSVVPYTLDISGTPIILISRLAQHTKNLIADNRCSFLVSDSAILDKQKAGRLTLMCEAELVNPDHVSRRYYAYFPETRGYHTDLDFDFYRLSVLKIRYIGGFGKIHWLSPESTLLVNPFEDERERDIVEHMNEDHVDAMIRYCRFEGIEVPKDLEPQMVGIDAEGFHLRLGEQIHRFVFQQPVSNPIEARTALVEMARRTLPEEA